jgi:hypothetical protein
MNRSVFAFSVAAFGCAALPVSAAITADGQYDADYGTILFTQDTPTGFGDNSDASTQFANGSEIDGVFATVQDGNLNLLVTGNLETNFNRLVLYFDSESGGQGTLAADTGGGFNDYSGIVFDTGFTADYGLILNGGNDPIEYFLDFADVGTSSTFLGGSGAGNTTISGSNGINVGVNQSNVLGVTDSATAGAGSVTTGLEFVIPLSVIGSPTDSISIAGFVAGGNFLSNQVIGGVGGAGNLGNDPVADFSQISGDQFVTVAVPEPASLALIGLGGALMLGRRRKA